MPKDIAKVIGFGKALEDAVDALDFEIEDIRELRDDLEEKILEVSGVYSLAPWALRIPNISIFAVEGVHASMLLDELATKDIIAYSFSTHNFSNFERISLTEINALPSYLKHTIIGFSLNNSISQEDINIVAKEFKAAVEKIRNFSGNLCKEQK
jgi:cysteine desulfurase